MWNKIGWRSKFFKRERQIYKCCEPKGPVQVVIRWHLWRPEATHELNYDFTPRTWFAAHASSGSSRQELISDTRGRWKSSLFGVMSRKYIKGATYTSQRRKFKPRPQNRILVPLKGPLQNCRWPTPSFFIWESPRASLSLLYSSWLIAKYWVINQLSNHNFFTSYLREEFLDTIAATRWPLKCVFTITHNTGHYELAVVTLLTFSIMSQAKSTRARGDKWVE